MTLTFVSRLGPYEVVSIPGPRGGQERRASPPARRRVFLSVLVIGEVRRGIERIRRRDGRSARTLDAWLRRLLASHRDRILSIDETIAGEWDRLNVPDPVPVVNGLMAATARVHGLSLAARTVKDFARTGVSCVNPFEPAAGEIFR